MLMTKNSWTSLSENCLKTTKKSLMNLSYLPMLEHSFCNQSWFLRFRIHSAKKSKLNLLRNISTNIIKTWISTTQNQSKTHLLQLTLLKALSVRTTPNSHYLKIFKPTSKNLFKRITEISRLLLNMVSNNLRKVIF